MSDAAQVSQPFFSDRADEKDICVSFDIVGFESVNETQENDKAARVVANTWCEINIALPGGPSHQCLPGTPYPNGRPQRTVRAPFWPDRRAMTLPTSSVETSVNPAVFIISA